MNHQGLFVGSEHGDARYPLHAWGGPEFDAAGLWTGAAAAVPFGWRLKAFAAVVIFAAGMAFGAELCSGHSDHDVPVVPAACTPAPGAALFEPIPGCGANGVQP